MYKIFLSLHYLRSRVIAYFAVLGVMLCVAMMLIVVCVMNGFLRKIESAAKGLFGDIIVEAGSAHGIERYDEFIKFVKHGPRRIPEVEAASPFIISHAFLRAPDLPDPNYFRQVQVVGIRLPERAEVSDFEQGLFVQAGLARPTFDPPMELILRRVDEEANQIRTILTREQKRAAEDYDDVPDDVANMLIRLKNAYTLNRHAAHRLRMADTYRREIDRLKKLREQAEASGDGEEAELLENRILRYRRVAYGPPQSRAILGVGIPSLSFRTEQGEIIRRLWPGAKIVLKIVPLGRDVSEMDLQLPRGMFTVCDDARTGVSSIDREIVYLPFKRLQIMNSMDQPDRCTQIHIKVRGQPGGELRLREIAAKVRRAWLEFDANSPRLGQQVSVQTWRQRQRRVIAPIEAQRTLVIIMFGIISLVSVFLIFVIFYMIAYQKTREIGLIKAIGGSNAGVAYIFLAYGAVVGLIGAVLGTAAGYLFVRNINPIHDWVARTFGLVVWDREVFMFDLIPNEVRWPEASAIALGAVVFGILGALLPSIVAARMQPVEALRYE